MLHLRWINRLCFSPTYFRVVSTWCLGKMVSAQESRHASAVVETVPIPWRDGAPLTVEIRRGHGGKKHQHHDDDDTEGSRQSPPAVAPDIAVVFVNGLGRPRAAWQGVADLLPSSYTLLTYDRFGQGDTPHLPDGVPASWHDGAAAARDIYELLCVLARRGEPGFDPSTARIVIVGHSIGAAIVRLLLANHQTKGPEGSPSAHDLDITAACRGVLLLDPSIVNSDFVSLYPPPTEDEPPELTRTREATRRVFHPSVPNPEGFDRAAFLHLLPLAEQPVLTGHPHLTVVGHDPTVIFGEDAEKMGISTKYSRQYIEPYWHEYNQKLLLAVPEGRRRGPVVAERSDHFIQLDRPDMVADEIVRLAGLILSKE